MILKPDLELAYTVATGADGIVRIRERWLAEVMCFNLPGVPEEPMTSPGELSPVAAPPLLSSRPSATAVLYLDFDGQLITSPEWTIFNEGNPITAEPAALGSAQISEVWERVSEDYRPFNIDVTTDWNRYQSAPVGQRMRVIVSPSKDWYEDYLRRVDKYDGPVGGVAYLESFPLAGTTSYSSEVPAWVFNATVTGVAEAIAHELGHTFGLSHDGRTDPVEEYFAGHGSGATSWAPIMGVGYSRSVTQWSKGEYGNANNQEDDVAIIAGLLPTPESGAINIVGHVADEAGNDRGSAVPLGMAGGAISQAGVISTAGDVDYFAFSTSAATLDIAARPGPFSPNLDIELELLDSQGNLLAAANPETALNASISHAVPSGQYFVKIRGSSRGDPIADGYSNYGSLGWYQISGSIYLIPDPPPVFTLRPLSRLAVVGETVTFTAAATDVGAVTYQWKRNGQPIPGATEAELTLYSIGLSDSGFYEVTATGASTPARSFFRLHVAAPGMAIAGWGYNVYGQASSPPDGHPIAAVTGGAAHSLALRLDGTVIGWGNAAFPETSIPAGLTNVVALAARGNTSMALKSDGTVAVWGNNTDGQNTPPEGLEGVIDIATGGAHCVALRADGTVVAWGSNSWGRTAVPVGLKDVVAVSAGTYHTAALKNDGTVLVWGHNINHPSQMPPSGLADVVAISAGSIHTLALKRDGSVVGWGSDYNGQVSIPASAMPARQIATGGSHSVALRTDGTVVVWGHNYYEQLAVPPEATGVSFVGTGDYHSLALVPPKAPVIASHPQGQTVNVGGNVSLTVSATGIPGPYYQWRKGGVPLTDGANVSGSNKPVLTIVDAQAGDAGSYDVVLHNVAGSVTSSTAAVVVTLPPQFATRPLSRVGPAGGSLTLEAPATGATTYLWAHNGSMISGETGSTLVLSDLSPAKAGSYVVTASNSAGASRSLVFVRVATNNVIETWGANNHGQLTVPSGLENVVEVSAGMAHTLALRPDGTVIAWGANGDGQSAVPAGLSGVVQVSAGEYHSVALKADGTLVAWGRNDAGQASVPAGLGQVAYVSAGGSHTVALKTDGTVVAWGSNTHGQTVVPSGLPFARLIAAGAEHTLAVTPSGGSGWGRNDSGQIATGLGTSDLVVLQAGRTSTVGVSGVGTLRVWGDTGTYLNTSEVNIASIALRDRHGLVLRRNGTVFAWGTNSSGETTIPSGLGNVVHVAAGGAHSVALVAPLPPTIFAQPESRTVSGGSSTVFAVNAGGARTFRWRKDGVDLVDGGRITGSDTATLSISNLTSADEGIYTVRLDNPFGATISNGATLTVDDLVITNQAGVAANEDGSQVTLSVAVSGNGTFTYQWYVGESGDTSAPVAGGTGSTLTVTQTQVQTPYWVKVGNGTASANGDTVYVGRWQVVDPWFGRAELSAATYANGRYVIVGEAAGHSPNAIDWEHGILEKGAKLTEVIHDGERFVSGGVRGQIFASSDGVSWQKLRSADPGLYDDDILRGAAHGNGITVFTGARGKVMSSTDGATWQWRPVGEGGEVIDLVSVAFNAGRFVAVGGKASSTTPVIYHSTDGVTWIPSAFSLNSSNSSYSFGEFTRIVHFGGRFVALGRPQYYSDAPAYVLTSQDGLNWTQPAFTYGPVHLGALTVAAGQLLAGDFRTSADGINWSEPHASPPYYLHHLSYGAGVHLALTSASNPGYSKILTSGDLKNWTDRVGFGYAGEIAYGNGRFVSVAREFTAHSPDGISWDVRRGSGISYNYGEVTYGDGLFVSVSASSYEASHYTSVDGETWTARRASVLGEYGRFYRIIHGGGQWIAFFGGTVYVSPDAINWTVRHSATGVAINDMVHGNGRYVGVGTNGAILTSLDGMTWTEGARPTDRHLRHVAFGNGMFVAIDANNVPWSSPDGVQWSVRSFPAKPGGYAGYIPNLAFGAGEFMAAYGSDILSSTDGIKWRVSPAALTIPSQNSSLSYFVGNLIFGAGQWWATGADSSRPFYWLKAPATSGVPRIQTNPSDILVAAGQSATLKVEAAGGGLSFQWYEGETGDTSRPVAGAVGATLVTGPVTSPAKYWVRITNTFGSANSVAATVQVGSQPAISVQPVDIDLIAGTTANLSVIATAAPAPTYQWYRGVSGDTSDPVQGAIGGGYAFTPTREEVSRFWVRVSNPLGSVDSVTAVVTPWFERPKLGSLENLQSVNGNYVIRAGSRMLHSLDGADWTLVGQGVPNLGPVAFGAGRYVGTTGSNVFGVSSDLRSWATHSPPPDQSSWAIDGIAYGHGRFVAGSGNQGGLLTSNDGLAWQRVPFGPGEAGVRIVSILFDLGRFIAVGSEDDGRLAVILHSENGLDWVRRPWTDDAAVGGTFTPLARVVRAGPHLFAIGRYPGTLMVSSSGSDWRRLPLTGPMGSQYLRSAAWINGMYVVGADYDSYFVSSDGANWTEMKGPRGFSAKGMAVHDGMLIATGNGRIHTSSDALNWVLRVGSPEGISSMSGVAFGNGQYVISGSWSDDYYSVDGKIWETTEVPIGRQTGGRVAFGNGRFICTDTDSAGALWSSTNGSHWEKQVVPGVADAFLGVSHVNGLFFALARGGQYATSTDGHTWTLHSIGRDVYLSSIVHGAGRYVMAANRRTWTSTDMVAWTESAEQEINISALAYGHGLFMAVGGANQGLILTSPDGLSWTKRFTYETNGVYDVVFDGERFAVAAVGHIILSRNGLNWSQVPLPNTHRITTGRSSFLSVGWSVWQSAPASASTPIIRAQPFPRSVTAGQNVVLSVVASGLDLSFQWRRNGVNLVDGDSTSGATSSTLRLNNIKTNDGGSYDVIVSNKAGTIVSSAVTVSVAPGVDDIPDGFDVQGYLTRNPQHASRFSGDLYGAWLYYRDVGVYQGEVFDDLFRPEEYLALHPELRAALGSDLKAALLHWLEVGRVEGWSGRMERNGSDFNKDRKSDIVWQNAVTGQRALWLMDGFRREHIVDLGWVDQSWEMAGTGDFNRDQSTDIVWQNTVTGQRAMWLMDGFHRAHIVDLGWVDPLWQMAGTGDFNRDQSTDILWQNTSTGQRALWLMDGLQLAHIVDLGWVEQAWVMAGTGEFNRDGSTDILWQNTSTGQRALWLMDNFTLAHIVNLGWVDPAWVIAGSGDYNADGSTDILWQNAVTGQRALWLMDNFTLAHIVDLGWVALEWKIAN